LNRSVLPPCLLADHCTGTGEIRAFTLADGSTATLNTDSAIEWSFEGGLRQVRLLSGEAFFDVRHDPQHPFVVDAPHSRTRVKGTRFIVREGGNHDTVTVLSGVVEVGRGERLTAVLKENDQVQMGQGANGEIGKVAAGVAAAWLRGGVLFDNVPLEQVVREIGRYRKGVLIVTDGRAKSLAVSGRFDITDTDRALESLEQTLPIKIKRITPWVVVIS
jgi:transmembrane sensor